MNLQPSFGLLGDIPLEDLFGCSPNYSTLHVFCCVCYVLLAFSERTKLTAQPVECVYLLGSGPRMHISWDVTFDHLCPFPSSLASSVEDIYFLTFPAMHVTLVEPFSIHATAHAHSTTANLMLSSPTVPPLMCHMIVHFVSCGFPSPIT